MRAGRLLIVILAGFMLWYPLTSLAQQRRIDSLERLLVTAPVKDRGGILNELAWVFHNVDPAKGLGYAREAETLFRASGNLKGEADALLYQGVCYNTLNNNEKAIEFYLRSLDLKEKLGDERGIAALLNNLGNIYKELRDYRSALEAYHKALEIGRRSGNKKISATSMSNIAVIYKLEGNYPEALKWNTEAMNIRSEAGDRRGLSASLNNMAVIYADTAWEGFDPAKAMDWFARSLAIKRETGDKYGMGQTLINMGEIRAETGRHDLAIPFFEEAVSVSEAAGAPAVTMAACQAMAASLARLGKFRQAYGYSQRYDRLRDSLYSVESSRKIAEMQVMYETGKKEQENLLLRQESSLKQLQIDRQRTVRNFLVVSVILVLGLAVAIFSRYLLKKRIQAQLMEANRQLSLLNATRDKFFSIIAHDLKNPFGTLVLVSGQLKERFHEFTDEQKVRSIALINQSAALTRNLLENLLEWSVSQSGIMPFQPVPFDLVPLATGSLDLVRLDAEKQGITLELRMAEKVTVLADYNMVSTVIRNLLSNAVRFSDKPGTIMVSAGTEGGMVKVSISDQGTGMSPGEVEQLFRIDADHRRIGNPSQKGTGLGLILCHEFVTRNGGQISVESEPGKGTTVIFTLPAG